MTSTTTSEDDNDGQDDQGVRVQVEKVAWRLMAPIRKKAEARSGCSRPSPALKYSDLLYSFPPFPLTFSV